MEYREKRKAQGQETEQKILETARQLMRKNGYDAVSIRDI